ncbi:MAG: hypothetical protein Tsb0018_04390 [Opitutales bacterium]
MIPRVIGELNCSDIDECSGIVESDKYPGVFWVHNDSDNRRFAPGGESIENWNHDTESRPRIFPITEHGKLITPKESSQDFKPGVLIDNAINDDWEDIAYDNKGNIILGDFGNNANARKDLAFYIVPEPDPFTNKPAWASKKIPFHYPDQKAFPPDRRNFDAEALFFAHGKIYVLTKHRSDTYTKLYRLDSESTDSSNELTLLDRFDVRGQVTGADASKDGSMLAVLTYSAIWVFKLQDGSDHFFDGEVLWLPVSVGKAEAICFTDPKTLLIVSEDGLIYEVCLSQMQVLKPQKPPVCA